MPEIQNMSHTHEAIARWLIANPQGSMRECAEFFGYSQSWLSCIVHSDAFKRYMHTLQGDANDAVIADVPTKLKGIAAQALDAIGEQLDIAVQDGTIQHREFIHRSAELALRSLGYGVAKNPAPAAPQGNNVQVNILSVPAEVIARAQARMLQPPTEAAPGPLALVGIKDITSEQTPELSARA
jgi:hypothetical protein